MKNRGVVEKKKQGGRCIEKPLSNIRNIPNYADRFNVKAVVNGNFSSDLYVASLSLSSLLVVLRVHEPLPCPVPPDIRSCNNLTTFHSIPLYPISRRIARREQTARSSSSVEIVKRARDRKTSIRCREKHELIHNARCN